MAKDSPSQMQPKVQIRMDEHFRQRLMEAAFRADRSLNAEIMARLERSFDDDAEAVEVRAFVDDHELRIKELERDVSRLLDSTGLMYE